MNLKKHNFPMGQAIVEYIIMFIIFAIASLFAFGSFNSQSSKFKPKAIFDQMLSRVCGIEAVK